MYCSELPRRASSGTGGPLGRTRAGRVGQLLLLWGALLAVSGCKKAEPTPDAPPLSPPPAAAPVAVDAPAAGPPPTTKTATTTAAELYGACRERVERPEKDGECASDADCVASGCSQELCTSKAAAAEGLMSTCEMRPCFKVLDACGCVEGRCSWSLKELAPGEAALPGMGNPIPLPAGSVPPVNQDAQQ